MEVVQIHMDGNTGSMDFQTEKTNTTTDPETTGEAEIDIPLLAQSHFYFQAGLVVNNYYGLCLVVIGLIGNTLSLLVMLQVGALYNYILSHIVTLGILQQQDI